MLYDVHMLTPISPFDGDPRHGTEYAYKTLQCSCKACRAAHNEHSANLRAKRKKNPLPADDPRHGKHSTYSNWSCRCIPCTEAARAYALSRRNKTKENH